MSASGEAPYECRQPESIKPILNAQDFFIAQTKGATVATNDSVVGVSSSIHPSIVYRSLTLSLSFSFPCLKHVFPSLTCLLLPPGRSLCPFQTSFLSLRHHPPTSSLPFHTASLFSFSTTYLLFRLSFFISSPFFYPYFSFPLSSYSSYPTFLPPPFSSSFSFSPLDWPKTSV